MTDTATIVNQVELDLEGVQGTLGLSRFTSDKGNPWWVLVRPGDSPGRAGKYGTKTQALGTELPAFAEVQGVTLPLLPGRTGSGNPKRGGRTDLVIDDVAYIAEVHISEPPSGGWNVIAKVYKKGTGGGSQQAATLEELLAK